MFLKSHKKVVGRLGSWFMKVVGRVTRVQSRVLVQEGGGQSYQSRVLVPACRDPYSAHHGSRRGSWFPNVFARCKHQACSKCTGSSSSASSDRPISTSKLTAVTGQLDLGTGSILISDHSNVCGSL